MTSIDLVRDLLDKRLQDRRGRFVGCVDSVVLEMDDDGSMTVAAVEVGAPAMLKRVHRVLGRWAHRLPVTRIPLSTLREIGSDIEVDIDAEHETQLLRVENWFRRHIVEHIPGNGR
jgi:hypothetical protein